MSERDELLSAVQIGMSNIDNWPDDVGYKLLGVNMSKPQNAVVDSILAAGYRKPRTITTLEELDALPDAVLVLTEQGGYWESIKRMDRKNWWKEPGSTDVVASFDLTLPATVIHEPTP